MIKIRQHKINKNQVEHHYLVAYNNKVVYFNKTSNRIIILKTNKIVVVYFHLTPMQPKVLCLEVYSINDFDLVYKILSY